MDEEPDGIVNKHVEIRACPIEGKIESYSGIFRGLISYSETSHFIILELSIKGKTVQIMIALESIFSITIPDSTPLKFSDIPEKQRKELV